MKIDTKRIVFTVLVILAITPVTSMQLLGHNMINILPSIYAQENDDDDVAPAPPSIGADIPLTYFGSSSCRSAR